MQTTKSLRRRQNWQARPLKFRFNKLPSTRSLLIKCKQCLTIPLPIPLPPPLLPTNQFTTPNRKTPQSMSTNSFTSWNKIYLGMKSKKYWISIWRAMTITSTNSSNWSIMMMMIGLYLFRKKMWKKDSNSSYGKKGILTWKIKRTVSI